MINSKRLTIFLAAFLVLSASAYAGDEVWLKDSVTVKLLFRQGSKTVDPYFSTNGEAIRDFFYKANFILHKPDEYRVSSLKLLSGTSPEGVSTTNAALAGDRLNSTGKFILNHLKLDKSLVRKDESSGVDWEGLATALEATDESWRYAAVQICRNVPEWISSDGVVTDGRKKRLMELEEGRAWNWMMTNVFPKLRTSEVRLVYERKGYRQPEPQTVPVTVRVVDSVKVVDTVYVKVPADRDRRKFVFALRTNFLTIPFLNFGAEIPIGDHWSIGADYYYPWVWRDSEHRKCYEFLAWDLEARYWFGKHRRALPEAKLTGHSLGFYAAMGYYDFQEDWSGHQGEYVNAGFDYLYALPIFRGVMHLEFELGIGYIYSQARVYDCFEPEGKCYRRPDEKKVVNWFGPTRAQVSLVVPIYSRNKARKAQADKRQGQ